MKNMEDINLSEQVGLNDLKSHERAIGYALFGMTDSEVGNMRFSFDDQGHLTFIDGDRLLSEPAFPCTIKDDKAAKQLAAKYLENSNKKLDEYFTNRRIKFPPFFPPSKNVDFKPPSITPILHPKTKRIDHWLCRYFLLLRPSFNEPFVPVFNAELQLRIGGKGNLLGLYYQWKPVVQSKNVKRYYVFIETHNADSTPIIASAEKSIQTYMLHGRSYNPKRISEPPEIAYYYEEDKLFVAPYYLGFSEENQIFVPASEYSKSLFPPIDFTPPYDRLKKILEKLSGVRFPELPSDQRLTADWQAMYMCWFFETKTEFEGAKWISDVEVEFDDASPYSTDLKNSVSYQEVKRNFLLADLDKPNPFGPKPVSGKSTGFRFTGEGSGIPNYYSWVEWFMGSYDMTINWTEVAESKFDIEIFISNKSGWYSGTRLPKTWQDKIYSVAGVQITNLVDDAPRGETVKEKLNPIVVNALESSGINIPSFGGNFWQYFHIRDTWEK